MVVNRIAVGSIARVAACLYGGIGLIIGICVFLVSLVGAGFAGETDGMPGWMAPLFGTGAVILLPILYGVMGAIGLSIAAALYNLAARLVGGVRFEVET